MGEEKRKMIILPKNLQKQMLDFFLKTSIKRKVENQKPLSNNQIKEK